MKKPPPSRNASNQSLRTDCLQNMVFFTQNNIKQQGKGEESSQVPLPLVTLSAKKDHISDNPQNGSNHTSSETAEASPLLNTPSRYICNLDDCLRLLKAVSDFLVESYKPLGGCLSGCTVNILALLIAIAGLITGNYWLLTAVMLPILRLLLEGGHRT